MLDQLRSLAARDEEVDGSGIGTAGRAHIVLDGGPIVIRQDYRFIDLWLVGDAGVVARAPRVR